MNEKSLNREELEELFNKYSYIKNINEIKFLAKINKPTNNTNLKFSNPNYSIIRPSDRNLDSFATARTIVEIPSPYRMGANNQPYITKIPLFTTDNYTECYKNIIQDDTEYIAGIGHLQNYKVIVRRKPNEQAKSFFYDLIVNKLEMKVSTVFEVERILGLLVDNNNKNHEEKQNMVLTNIWCNNIENGNDLATKKIEEKKLPEINEATIQGIVYMPPSIREIKNKEEYSVHFKVRVKRQKDDINQHVPKMHEADYDYINVIVFGQQALEAFDSLKQGHPVLVTGRIESSKFLKAKRINQYQKEKIAELLNMGLDTPYIRAIENYFIDNNITIEYPNFNVWANKIITDENSLLK